MQKLDRAVAWANVAMIFAILAATFGWQFAVSFTLVNFAIAAAVVWGAGGK
jgi:hypothetical protein